MKRLLVIAASIGLAGLLLPGAASALTFSPPTFDFSANPGDAIADAVRLHNEGPEPVTLKVEAVNFTSQPGDETSGVPDFYPAEEIRDGRGLAPWISFINPELTIQPGERGSVFFEIKVPSDAGPGSYFGAAIVTSLAPNAGEGVGVIGNTAILIMLKVNGDAREEARLTAFTAAPKFASDLPIAFEARIENAGTTHLRPYGDIRIRDLFGRVAAVVPINRLEYKSVLPGGARRYQAEWTDGLAIGPYTAELTMEYGLQRRPLTATARIWIVPIVPLAAAALGIAALAAAIRALLRWYRKRIIAQFEESKKRNV